MYIFEHTLFFFRVVILLTKGQNLANKRPSPFESGKSKKFPKQHRLLLLSLVVP